MRKAPHEAQGNVVDTTGAPWTLTSGDLVAITPGLASNVAAILHGPTLDMRS